MPFKSEAQRRYLWANEPEIARDWTDTYGSRIAAALGGIMALAQGGRINYAFGGTGGKTGGGGPGPGGQGARGQATQNPGVTGTNGTTGTNKGDEIDRMLTRTFTVEKPKGFFDGLLGGIWDTYKTISPTYNVYKALTTELTPQQKLQANIDKGLDVSNPAEMHGAETRTGPTSGPDRGGNQYIAPQYINDVYAQNVMEEDGLDIDTSTGNMEDWVQRFRLADAYRQHPGTIDKPIRYT